MDGKYFKIVNDIKTKKVIEDWIHRSIVDFNNNKILDLHIDEINDFYNKKKYWVQGSLFLYNYLSTLIDKNKYFLILSIPLKFVHSDEETLIKSIKQIEKELDNFTPPSFYLLPKNSEVFTKTILRSLYMKNISTILNFKVYLQIIRDKDEFDRTLFLYK